MKMFSIRERLILYFVVVGVISIAMVSLFSIFEAKKGIRHRTFSQLVLLRDLRKEQIQAFFDSRSSELKFLAATDGIIEISGTIEDNQQRDSSFEYKLKDQHLLDLVADTNLCKSSYYISSRGNSYKFGSKNNKDEFHLEKQGINLDTAHLSAFKKSGNHEDHLVFEEISPNDVLRIFVAVPVIIRGDYSGAIVYELFPDDVYRITYAKIPGTGLGETGEAYLVGLDGLMRSPSRFIRDAVLKVTVETDGFKKASDNHEGAGIYKDYRGIEVLGAYGSIETGGLKRIILAEIDSDEAMVPLNAIRNEILFLSLIIIAVIFIVAWFVAYGITRPLVRLKNAANFITLGNYDQQLEVKVNDEIGELTRAFNAMAMEINSTTQELKDNEERLHHYYRANLDGQDIERQRLSRELHDGLGQQLVAGKLMLEGSLYADGIDLKQKITEAQAIFDQIIGDIRRISHNLSPSILQEFGLKAAVENLCNNFMKTSGIEVDILVDLIDVKPDAMTSTYLFRISQEGLNNVQRHSGATKVNMILSKIPEGILLEIQDNGCGFRVKEVVKRGGNGLYNIRERVNILKGDLSIKSCPGQGTKIQVKIPYVKE
jgi:two-component system, NarL family, sensor kinase